MQLTIYEIWPFLVSKYGMFIVINFADLIFHGLFELEFCLLNLGDVFELEVLQIPNKLALVQTVD